MKPNKRSTFIFVIVTGIVSILFVSPASAVTIPPTLTSPSASASVPAGSIPIQYTLGEAPAAGSVQLLISGGPNTVSCLIVLTDSISNSFTLDVADINIGASGGNIISVNGCTEVDPGSGYTFTLIYQNVVVDPAASASSANITIATSVVTSSPTTTTVPASTQQSPAASLPETGVDSTAVLFAATALLLVGFLFFRVTRIS